MNRFGNRNNINDFFGDAYEKTSHVTLNTGKDKEKDLPGKDAEREDVPARKPLRNGTEIEETPVRRPLRETGAEPSEAPVRRPLRETGAEPSEAPARRPIRETSAEPTEAPARRPIRETSAEPTEAPARKTIRETGTEPPGAPARKPIRETGAEPTEAPVRKPLRETGAGEDFVPVRKPLRETGAETVQTRSYSREPSRELKTPAGAPPRNNDRVPPKGGSGSGSGSGGQHKKSKPKKRRVPIAVAIIIDILVAVLLFVFFCQQNSFWIFDTSDQNTAELTPTASVSETVTPSPTETVSAKPTSTQSNKPTATPTATVDPNSWRAKFADKFSSDGKVHTQTTDNSWTYQSANIDVNITKKTGDGSVYYVTDIYVADIKYFRTSFGDGPDKEHTREFVYTALKNVNGVVGINGDYYPDNGGLTVRNSQYYKYKGFLGDVLVMYNDGTMKAFLKNDFDVQGTKAQVPDKVYQVWTFGPMLLDNNGQPLTKFNSTVNVANPRTAIGYYEPGHYCFVTVEGRQVENSSGYTTAQLAKFMSGLGCKVAYNLDGGGSSQLAFMGNDVSHACSDKRPVFDIIYVTDQG